MLIEGSGRPVELIGISKQIAEVRELVRLAGYSSSPVLLLGETGTGKELVARMIHEVNSKGAFVPIDCSTLVESLVESELFGHVRGAFTGAVGPKMGLIERAQGGTAFFDEIGEVPLGCQAKLLRLLQEREFRPVGSLTPRKVAFRVIAATNQDLAEAVKAGRFRADLYYRLNVITIHLSPLRERKEDIPLLIEHFLAHYRATCRLSPECLDALVSYDWPGNVRELENWIRRVAALNSGEAVGIEQLPAAVRDQFEGRSRNKFSVRVGLGGCHDEDHSAEPYHAPVLTLTELEKAGICEALQRARGCRILAARLLGIGRTTLYRKMKQYGLTSFHTARE